VALSYSFTTPGEWPEIDGFPDERLARRHGHEGRCQFDQLGRRRANGCYRRNLAVDHGVDEGPLFTNPAV
jgi:hypothetical protein